MTRLRQWLDRLRNSILPGRSDRDLEEELQSHLALASEDAGPATESPHAMRLARARWGGITQAMDDLRDQGGLPWLSDLPRQVRRGSRALLTRPAFTLVSILSLALGLGVNAAVFSLTRELLLRPLPYAEADRLVRVFEVDRRAGRYPGPVSPINYFAWRERMNGFEQTTMFRRVSFNVSMATSAVQVEGFRVDSAFFPLLGVVPALGRGFSPDEMKPGRDNVVLLTDGFWHRQFGGAESILGQSLVVDGTRCTVVGVLPATFSIFRVLNRELQVFRPLVVDPTDHEQSLNVYARLKPGVSVDAASAELATVYTTLPIPGHQWSAGTASLTASFAAKGRSVVLLLEWAVALVLLIACANIANLLLTAWIGRRKELALRQALGGSRWRVACDVGAETLILTSCGGALALLLAVWIVGVLNASVSYEDIGRLHPFRVDGWVAVFTLGLTVVVTIVFTLLTAHAASSTDVVHALKDESHGTTSGVANRRLRQAFIAGEVALSVVLAASALALTRSALQLGGLARGFAADHVMTGQLALNDPAYDDVPRLAATAAFVQERLRTSPGVSDAALVNYPPLSLIRVGVPVSIEGVDTGPADRPPFARYWVVSPGYFRTLQIPVLAGRDFTLGDTADRPGVAIVSESFARRYWHRADVTGTRITPDFPQSTAFWIPRGTRGSLTVVGVVGDVREDGLPDAAGLPQLYLPYPQHPTIVITVVARTTGAAPESISPNIKEAVRFVDSQLPLSDEQSLEAMMGETFAAPRTMAWLIGAFAALALVLSAAGVYGVMAYVTAARTREIGIRVALGATRTDIASLIVGHAMRMTAVGLAIGVLLAPIALRLLQGLLFGVRPFDATTLVVVVCLLSAVSLAASLTPVARALRVPAVSLR
jgi:putative ABC transport system permease protein